MGFNNHPKMFPQGLLNLKMSRFFIFLRRMAIFFSVLRVSGSRQVEGKTSLLPLEPLEPLREVRSFQRAKNFMVIKRNP